MPRGKRKVVSKETEEVEVSNGAQEVETITKKQKKTKASTKEETLPESSGVEIGLAADEADEMSREQLQRLMLDYFQSWKAIVNDRNTSDVAFDTLGGEINAHERNVNSNTEGSHVQTRYYGHRSLISLQSSKLKDLIEKSREKIMGGQILVQVPTESSIFGLLLEGIYTFQVKPKPEQVLPLMLACDEYQLTKLGESLRIGSCTPENVCTVVEGCFRAKNMEALEFYMKYLEKHADKVFVGRNFMELSEETFSAILDSNDLCVDESELFEALVAWGGEQVTRRGMTGDKIKNMRDLLTPLLEKIRFPLIPVSALQNVVEQKKIVPDQLLLEAYRYHATSYDKKDSLPMDKKKYMPRGFVFPGWCYSFVGLLKIWIAEKEGVKPAQVTFRSIMYQATRDGISANEYHTRVDGRGKNIVIALGSTGHVFGGYNPIGWENGNAYKADQKAFIFSLTDGKGRKPHRSDMIASGSYTSHSIYNQTTYGPAFGGGHDLYFMLSSTISGYCNVGYSYVAPTGPGTYDSTSFAGSNTFTCNDLVVIDVIVGKN